KLNNINICNEPFFIFYRLRNTLALDYNFKSRQALINTINRLKNFGNDRAGLLTKNNNAGLYKKNLKSFVSKPLKAMDK
ncbi:MAG TPA: hypothetical protein VGO09_07495, partial [Flavisolibacter sp.]|nr:hypothetical protein [Flavisolibacter sp.]